MKKPYRKIPGQPLNKEIFNIRLHPDKLMQKQTAVRNYAQEVPEEAGTIEAEKGETIVGNMNHDGMPMFQKIGGKSHAQGGTILNAPDNAYVFSKFNKMKIKNPYILQSFGLDPFSAKTPAQISSKYDFSDSVRGLFDPMSDKLQIKTYEMNVKNSINKLGKLALVQEGTKGFPQGVPKISEPYLINTGMSPDLFIGNEPEDFNDQGMPMARRGGQLRRYQKTGEVDSVTIARAKFLAKSRGISYDDALRTVKEEKIKGDSVGKKKVVIKKAPEKQQKLVKKVPEQSLGFKSAEAAKEFQSKYPTYYTAFLNAYNTGKDIDNTIKLLKEYDVEAEFEKPSTWFSSQGWLPASDQDKFEDLAGQLEEKRDRNKVRKRDNDIANSAETAYNALQRVKNQALINGNTFLAAEIEGKLNKIQKLRPSYKDDPSGWTWYRYEDKRVPLWNSIGETLFNSVEPDKMYNEEEEQFLRNDVVPYMNNLAKSLQGTQPIKKAATKKTIPTDSIPQTGLAPIEEDTAGFAEALRLSQQKKYGGNIISFPLYKEGGIVSEKTHSKGGKVITYGDGEVIWVKSNGAEIQIQAPNPNWKPKAKVNQSQVKNAPLTAKGFTYVDDLEKDPKLKEQFEKVKSIFFDPSNEAMRDAIYEDYLKRPGVNKRSKDELFDLLFKAQRQVFALANQPLDHDLWDKPQKFGRKKNSEYIKAMTDIGQTPLGEQEIYDFQSVYHTMQDLSEDPKYKDNFKFFKLTPRSTDRSATDMRGGKPISRADKVWGDSTAKQGIFLAEEEKPIKVNKEEKPTDTKIKTKGLEVEETPKGKVGKWWWQDRVQALADLQDRASIKKYYPQTFDPDLYIADPTFYDPNRELAQQASIANLGTRAARKMFDPQRFSSIFSNIQGTAAEQAANTLGRYNNLNVGVANQFAQNTANALGAFSRGLAANRTQNARDLAILNQQYDNALRQMRARQTGNFKQAITNMAKTDVLNSLYPQYAIDPETGGTRPEFLRGRVPKPVKEKTIEDSLADIYKIMEADPTGKTTFTDALNFLNNMQNQSTSKAQALVNPHQYPESRGWEGSYPTKEEEEEDNQSTAYNYDYWDNQQEDEEEYDPYSDYDYEGTA